MKRARTLPLGIDVGSARTRVALTSVDERGQPTLVAVAARPSTDDPAIAICEAVAELETKERRCVFGVRTPHALLKTVRFPPMRRNERERAARFEAVGLIDYAIDDAAIRLHSIASNRLDYALGIIKKSVMIRLQKAAKAAKLSLIAIDDEALALSRVFPDSEAILDVGSSGAILHLFGRRLPTSHRFATGGDAFTEAIAGSLGIDRSLAEHRKVTYGFAGSGNAVRDAFIESVASEIIEFRAAGTGDVRSMTLVGNGARVPALVVEIERATSIPTRLAAFAPDVSNTLPSDVLRAAAPDWSCAVGLSTWLPA